MKRLAAVAIAIGVMGVVGAAKADPEPGGRRARACWQGADAIVRTGVEGAVHIDVGLDLRRPSPRAFVCYMAPEGTVGDAPFAGVFSTFVDPENGRFGYSCSKRKGWNDIPCGHDTFRAPLHATTPVGHPEGPWGVGVLGIDLAYVLDSSTVGVAVGTPERCVGRRCAALRPVGVGVRRDPQYRALGPGCTSRDPAACELPERPVAFAGGEPAQPSTITVGGLTLDVLAVCAGAPADVRC